MNTQLFEGFTKEDFSAYSSEKWSSNAFNRQRQGVKEKLKRLGGLIRDSLGVSSLYIGTSPEYPSQWNGRKVQDQWLFVLVGSPDELRRVERFADKERSLALLLADPLPEHKHLGLTVSISLDRLDVGLVLWQHAAIDRKNLSFRLASLEGKNEFQQISAALGALQVRGLDGTSLTFGQLAESLQPFEALSSLSVEEATSTGAFQRVVDVLSSLLPLLRFGAWTEENDHLGLVQKLQEEARLHEEERRKEELERAEQEKIKELEREKEREAAKARAQELDQKDREAARIRAQKYQEREAARKQQEEAKKAEEALLKEQEELRKQQEEAKSAEEAAKKEAEAKAAAQAAFEARRQKAIEQEKLAAERRKQLLQKTPEPQKEPAQQPREPREPRPSQPRPPVTTQRPSQKPTETTPSTKQQYPEPRPERRNPAEPRPERRNPAEPRPERRNPATPKPENKQPQPNQNPETKPTKPEKAIKIMPPATPNSLKTGDRVQILEGPFRGKIGTIQEINQRREAKIVLGTMTTKANEASLAKVVPA